MDTLKDLLNKLNNSDIPTGAFAVVAVVVLVLGLKSSKFIMRLLLGLAALLFVAGAVWWHYHKR
jgi:hypothetical protein